MNKRDSTGSENLVVVPILSAAAKYHLDLPTGALKVQDGRGVYAHYDPSVTATTGPARLVVRNQAIAGDAPLICDPIVVGNTMKCTANGGLLSVFQHDVNVGMFLGDKVYSGYFLANSVYMDGW